MEGHFKEAPLVPGVVQLHWAFQYAKQTFQIDGFVTQAKAIKFNNILQGGSILFLELEHSPENEMITYKYCDHESVYSSGRLSYGQEETA